jgi:hypothetical protein
VLLLPLLPQMLQAARCCCSPACHLAACLCPQTAQTLDPHPLAALLLPLRCCLLLLHLLLLRCWHLALVLLLLVPLLLLVCSLALCSPWVLQSRLGSLSL